MSKIYKVKAKYIDLNASVYTNNKIYDGVILEDKYNKYLCFINDKGSLSTFSSMSRFEIIPTITVAGGKLL